MIAQSARKLRILNYKLHAGSFFLTLTTNCSWSHLGEDCQTSRQFSDANSQTMSALKSAILP